MAIKTDSITDKAGTGAPDFPNGLTTGTLGTVRLNTGNGHGSSNTNIRRFSVDSTVGDAFTYADSSTLGMSITVNRDCVATINYTDRHTAVAGIGISVNSSELSTNIVSINADDTYGLAYVTANTFHQVSATIKLNAGDVVRAHTDGAPAHATFNVQFMIQEIVRLG